MLYEQKSSDDNRAWPLTKDRPWVKILAGILTGGIAIALAINRIFKP
jgi:hypothetical protein